MKTYQVRFGRYTNIMGTINQVSSTVNELMNEMEKKGGNNEVNKF